MVQQKIHTSETALPLREYTRKGDGFVVLLQDNAARRVAIESVNPLACDVLGYTEEELLGRPLQVLLGQRTALFLEEELEYDDEAPDLADVLQRERELKLRTRGGTEDLVYCSISRLMAQDRCSRFQLMIPNDREGRARKQLRDFLRLNLEGHQQLDSRTGLPTRATGEAYMRLLHGYLVEHQVEVAFASLRLDRFDKSRARYGQTACLHLLQHVANCCRATFRAEDAVFLLGEDTIGLLLLDISRDSARVVLNRLRWNIRHHTIEFGGKSNFSNTVSIAFDMLTADNSESLIDLCQQATTELDADERNILIERGA